MSNLLNNIRKNFTLTSTSKTIFKTCKNNKIPESLSLSLDSTLKTNHNVLAFSLGTLASMSNRDRYARFIHSMHNVYEAMEEELDRGASTARIPSYETVWSKYGDTLRRSHAIRQDLDEVISSTTKNGDLVLETSLATKEYVRSIREAGEEDRHSGGGRLLGHVYCRYMADLFGGQMLANPYKDALRLERVRRYSFDFDDRGLFVDALYGSFNEAGNLLSEEQRREVVDETCRAFNLNVNVYTEEFVGVDALFGLVNYSGGIIRRIKQQN